MLRDHGRHPWTKDLFNEEFSFKYMPSNLTSFTSLLSIKKIKLLLKLKRNIFLNYKKYLKKIEKEILMNQDNSKVVNSCWSIIIYFKEAKLTAVEKIKKELIKNNFFPRPFFYPLTSIPAFKKIDKNYKKYKVKNPIAYKTQKRGLVLPSSYIIKENQIKRICKIIIRFLDEKKKNY
jgi:perosamine synthetase